MCGVCLRVYLCLCVWCVCVFGVCLCVMCVSACVVCVRVSVHSVFMYACMCVVSVCVLCVCGMCPHVCCVCVVCACGMSACVWCVCVCVSACVVCVFVCVLSQVPGLTLVLGRFPVGLSPLPAAHRQLPVLPHRGVHWGSAVLAACAEVGHPQASLAQAGVLRFSFVALRPGSVLGPCPHLTPQRAFTRPLPSHLPALGRPQAATQTLGPVSGWKHHSRRSPSLRDQATSSSLAGEDLLRGPDLASWAGVLGWHFDPLTLPVQD